jgi:hypothetical protein
MAPNSMFQLCRLLEVDGLEADELIGSFLATPPCCDDAYAAKRVKKLIEIPSDEPGLPAVYDKGKLRSAEFIAMLRFKASRPPLLCISSTETMHAQVPVPGFGNGFARRRQCGAGHHEAGAICVWTGRLVGETVEGIGVMGGQGRELNVRSLMCTRCRKGGGEFEDSSTRSPWGGPRGGPSPASFPPSRDPGLLDYTHAAFIPRSLGKRGVE